MNVVLTREARNELSQIWNHNAKARGIEHADRYVAFLYEQIENLSETYLNGKVVEARPDLRYLLMRRKSRGHGHIVVYSISGEEIVVLHIFHTAQNWQNR